MHGFLLSIKETGVPLASSLCLHAVVISGLILTSDNTYQPGRSGGSGQVVEVSLEGDLPGRSEEINPVFPVSSGKEVPDVAEKKFIIPVSEAESVRRVRQSRGPAQSSAVSGAAPVSPGTGGGTGGGSGSGNGSEGDGGIVDGFVRAAVVAAPKPPFPEKARQAGFEGKVVLSTRISESGSVVHAAVQDSSGRSDCDATAIDTVLKEWKFEPARLGGQPVSSQEKIVITYNLRR